MEGKDADFSKSNKLTYVAYVMRGIFVGEVYFFPESCSLRLPTIQLQFGLCYFVDHSFHAQGLYDWGSKG